MSLFERLKNKRLSLQEKKEDKKDKGVKQSEVSKQAKKFTKKIKFTMFLQVDDNCRNEIFSSKSYFIF